MRVRISPARQEDAEYFIRTILSEHGTHLFVLIETTFSFTAKYGVHLSMHIHLTTWGHFSRGYYPIGYRLIKCPAAATGSDQLNRYGRLSHADTMCPPVGHLPGIIKHICIWTLRTARTGSWDAFPLSGGCRGFPFIGTPASSL